MRKLISVFLTGFFSIGLHAQNANLEWQKYMSSTAYDEALSMAVDASGNIYNTGRFDGIADFDPGPGVYNLSSAGFEDIFISKLDASGNLLWARALGDTQHDKGGSITVDAAGNVYTTGYFEGTVDFDPGAGTYTLTSQGDKDGFISKLDASGNFVWAKNIGGTGADYTASIACDPSGNLFITGQFQNTVDFDPGTGAANITAVSSQAAYILKLDGSGSFVWVKDIQGNAATDFVTGDCIKTDAAGSIYIAGGLHGSADFDPGTGVFNLSANMFVAKYDAAGSFIYAKNPGGSMVNLGALYNCSQFIDVDNQNNLYITGSFTGTVDLDPGTAVANFTAGGKDAFITKLDANGSYVWAKAFQGNWEVWGVSLAVDALGNVYTTGLFGGYYPCTADFDPGPGVYNMTSLWSSSAGANWPGDMFAAKLNASGEFVWAKHLGGAISSLGTAITTDAAGRVYVAGGERLSTTGMDAVVYKFYQDGCSMMSAGVNSVVQPGCVNPGSIDVSGINGIPPYSYSWNTTPVSNTSSISVTDPGVYTVTVTDDSMCSHSMSLLMNTDTYPTGYDLDVNSTSSIFRPGISTTIQLDAFNNGCVPVNGSLKLVLTNQLTYNSANPAPDQISGDTLIWNFISFNYDSPHLVPYVNVTTNASIPPGDTICLTAIMTPQTGDAFVSNNVKNWCYLTTNSYDPNVISVYPQGACEEHYILPSDVLTYSIVFQNTGNANAANIHIIDSLDSHLDLGTVKVLGSSHPMYTEILPGNKLNFRFDNIQLPDSNANEPLSHGYVIYEVHQTAGVPDNTVINNQASIYFDFNPAVFTNTETNTVIGTIPSCGPESVAQVTQKPGLNIYPNPATESIEVRANHAMNNAQLRLTDVTGRTVLSRNVSGDHINIDISMLSAGLYMVEIQEGGANLRGKLVKR